MREIGGISFYSDLAEIVAPQHTALLVVDMQNDFVADGGHFARHGRDVARIQAIIPTLRDIVAAARRAGVLTVYTKSPDYTLRDSWGAEFVNELAPPPEVPVVDKFRPSAFYRTTLDETLRGRGIESVVVAGCVTQGCVQATTTDASYHDYYAVVAEDAVQSTSPAMHENALAFLRSRYDLVPVRDLTRIWLAGGAT
jgi:nicotinamidase-related amidase